MKTRKKYFTDEQVEIEIERLRNSELVKLARKEINIKCKRRQAFYNLRALEKRGKELQNMGFTRDTIEEKMLGNVEEME